MNSDTAGYHETITRAHLHGIRLFLAEADRSEPLHKLVNALLLSPMGRRDLAAALLVEGEADERRGAARVRAARSRVAAVALESVMDGKRPLRVAEFAAQRTQSSDSM